MAKKTDADWNDGLTQNLLWSCVHPCAFMCYMIQQGHLPADEQVMKTLDAHGYQTPGGFPDVEAMEREFNRVRNENSS